MDEVAIRLAVIAHIRNAETEYDTLLARGCERREAPAQVAGGFLECWLGGKHRNDRMQD